MCPGRNSPARRGTPTRMSDSSRSAPPVLIRLISNTPTWPDSIRIARPRHERHEGTRHPRGEGAIRVGASECGKRGLFNLERAPGRGSPCA